MIADLIKLVRLGALVFVLLPMMKLDYANANDVKSPNARDMSILSVDLAPNPDMSLDKIEGLLNSVREKDQTTIYGVSVTQVLSMTKLSSDDCSLEKLLMASEIHEKVLGHEQINKFVEHHLDRYTNACFSNVDTVTEMLEKSTTQAESSIAMVKAFIRKQFPELMDEDSKFEAEDNMDEDKKSEADEIMENQEIGLMIKNMENYIAQNEGSDYLKQIESSCKLILDRTRMLASLLYLKDGQAKDKAEESLKKIGNDLATETCIAFDVASS